MYTFIVEIRAQCGEGESTSQSLRIAHGHCERRVLALNVLANHTGSLSFRCLRTAVGAGPGAEECSELCPHDAHTFHLSQRGGLNCGFVVGVFLDVISIPESPGTTWYTRSLGAEPHARPRRLNRDVRLANAQTLADCSPPPVGRRGYTSVGGSSWPGPRPATATGRSSVKRP